MNRTNAQWLRGLLGESIPPGGDDTNTMFTDEEIDDFLEQGGAVNSANTVFAAAWYGWYEKMANYANLVTVNEGNALRELTELHKNAQRMITRFEPFVPAPGKGAVRIGRIVRERR